MVLPTNGTFTAHLGDGTVFPIAALTPATMRLVLSSETGLTSGTLNPYRNRPFTLRHRFSIADSGQRPVASKCLP